MFDFRNNEKEKLERTILVDSRPLDSLVQRSVATAMVKNPDDSFRHTHAIEIGALALADLAEHYLQSVATTYNVRIKEDEEEVVPPPDDDMHVSGTDFVLTMIDKRGRRVLSLWAGLALIVAANAALIHIHWLALLLEHPHLLANVWVQLPCAQ